MIAASGTPRPTPRPTLVLELSSSGEEPEAGGVLVAVGEEEVANGTTEENVAEVELVDVAEVVEGVDVDMVSVFDHMRQLTFHDT